MTSALFYFQLTVKRLLNNCLKLKKIPKNPALLELKESLIELNGIRTNELNQLIFLKFL